MAWQIHWACLLAYVSLCKIEVLPLFVAVLINERAIEDELSKLSSHTYQVPAFPLLSANTQVSPPPAADILLLLLNQGIIQQSCHVIHHLKVFGRP
jgi:hypothetical protein